MLYLLSSILQKTYQFQSLHFAREITASQVPEEKEGSSPSSLIIQIDIP